MASVSEGLRSLLRAKLRSALALTGIVIGVGSVITMISIGEIARETTRAQFEALGTDIVTIGNVDGASVAPGRSIVLADALVLADSVPSILDAAPRIELHDGFLYAGKELARGPVHGVTGAFARINQAGDGPGAVHLRFRPPQAVLRAGCGRRGRHAPCRRHARRRWDHRPDGTAVHRDRGA